MDGTTYGPGTVQIIDATTGAPCGEPMRVESFTITVDEVTEFGPKLDDAQVERLRMRLRPHQMLFTTGNLSSGWISLTTASRLATLAADEANANLNRQLREMSRAAEDFGRAFNALELRPRNEPRFLPMPARMKQKAQWKRERAGRR